jgi:GGDEF domain-containing protein
MFAASTLLARYGGEEFLLVLPLAFSLTKFATKFWRDLTRRFIAQRMRGLIVW